MLGDSYSQLQSDIEKAMDVDYSGTTLCGVIVRGRMLFAANVGDSRAILVTANHQVKQLTRD